MLKISNCLIFAVLEAIRNGQYVVIRKTKQQHRWPFCKYHFLVLPREVVKKHGVSYVPPKPLGNWPCPLFKGIVKRGD